MHFVTRSSAAALLVGGGLLAPVATAPVAERLDVMLAAIPADEFLDKLAAANADLVSRFDTRIDQVLADNAGLVADGKGDDMMTSATQAAALGVLGARTYDPLELNASLLSDPDSAYAEFGGMEGLLLQQLTPDPSLLDELNGFNTGLIGAQYAFNAALVDNQTALAQAVFGADNPLEDVVNRAFNAFNLLFDAQQQGLNGLLGVTDYDPQELTASLLHGSGPFNGGDVGGVLGSMFQNIALLGQLPTDSSDLSGLFDDFDSSAFTEALQDLFGTLDGGPFGDALAGLPDLLADLL